MLLTRKSVFVFLCLLFSITSFAKESFVPEIVEIVPDHIFSPQGFDDNDKAEIVVDGTLKSSCYKLGPTDFRIEEGKVFIRQYAYYYRGFCMAMESSYTTPPVSLGILKMGNYQIVAESNGEQIEKAQLPIGVASKQEADEYLYAPVSEARLSMASVNEQSHTKNYALTIKGMFYSGCTKIVESNFIVKRNDKAGVIEVLPILEGNDKVCAPIARPYEAVVNLQDVPAGRYLVHIRSLSGASYNLVRDL